VAGAGQHEPGAVVGPVQYLHVRAVRRAPVGEVGLPGLVGLRGLEPDDDSGALYEDASLSYVGIASHGGLQKIGLYDTVAALEN
jgi:hypothetical protein